MSESFETPSETDAAKRFRRIISEGDEETSPNIEAQDLTTGQLSHHPTGQPDETGGWFEELHEEGKPERPAPIPQPDLDETLKDKEVVPEPPPPELGSTPPHSAPAIGTFGLPLPRRVTETDTDATRVTPRVGTADVTRVHPVSPEAARMSVGGRQAPSQPRTSSLAQSTSGGKTSIPTTTQVSQPTNQKRWNFDWSLLGGCLVRSFVLALFGSAILVVCLFSIMLVQYFRILQELPDIENLRDRASKFETTRILDRNGNVLYEILDPNAGRRTYVPLEKISPYLVAATIATEDKEYYNHPGYDVFAIFRAFYQNLSSGDTVSGASTITQQLARNLLFSPEERSNRSYQRKVREAILAAELTRRYSKDEILEIYLNENYYGNLAYGVEAAAETYFRTSADKLTLAQAAFLAGLPQAPAIYDIYTNREATLKRFSDVLVLMYRVSQEQGCIYVSNSPQPVCVDPVTATKAREEMLNYSFPSPNIPMKHPHWVNYIRQQLETEYDVQTIYRSGFSVYTTLDSELQQLAERFVKEQVDRLKDKNVKSGALVAIHPPSGEILAMVGSADFEDETIDGQVNMAISPRQPGSSIKPITYLAAFEKGWTPATLIWDVPSEFPPSGRPEDTRPPYKPINYDEKFHGPVTVRVALANSYNVPAVKALQFVGIYDDPLLPGEDGFLAMARRLGITTLNREDYGLSLTLGGGEVTLLELTHVYATLANMGRKTPLISISKILDHDGNVVYEAPRGPVQQVLRPEHVFLITSILSDNEARAAMFGRNSPLNLPFPAAAKTGTTNDFRDNWTLGYTPDLAVGVWVGNADYTPMSDVSGISGAAPIWSEFMQSAVPKLTGGKVTPFVRPAGIVDKVICAVSGTEPSQWCPKQTTEIFAADQPPLPKEEDLWQMASIDTWTGLKASAVCSEFTKEEFVLNVTDPFAKQWIQKDPDGKRWAEQNGFEKKIRFVPERECKADDPRPKLEFISPKDGDTITRSVVDIYLWADATQWFKSFQLDFGIGADPKEWTTIVRSNTPAQPNDPVVSWDLTELPNGLVTLRLIVQSEKDTYAEKKIQVILQVPTPTPTSTPTPTETLIPTPTFTPTSTSTPVPTQTETPTVTPTP
ncbi:MAG: hypothetical protein DDG59_10245 [Anaerolineae bacterium]|jgi:penicillin-binding protein 1C|nr:MAG: hypothetical protein DDG59_10245 [Anaerolineae bacterium]